MSKNKARGDNAAEGNLSSEEQGDRRYQILYCCSFCFSGAKIVSSERDVKCVDESEQIALEGREAVGEKHAVRVRKQVACMEMEMSRKSIELSFDCGKKIWGGRVKDIRVQRW